MRHEEQLLEELRPDAFAIAYRMLGSVAEAEDVVQESLLKLHRALAAGECIASPRAYLTTVTTRQAIDVLRSARARREQYVGDWLPEPIITDRSTDPELRAELADSLSVAMLVLLERLSPEQRAVLLLHDVFDYGYAEIAGMLGKEEANVRQLATRARRHVDQCRPRFQSSLEQQDDLARRFLDAARDGDLAGLETLLSHDVVLTGDGGGNAPSPPQPVQGRADVARTVRRWLRIAVGIRGATLHPARVNAGPGALMLAPDGRLVAVWALEIADGEIRGIRSVVNPDKLRHLGPVTDLGSLLRGSG